MCELLVFLVFLALIAILVLFGITESVVNKASQDARLRLEDAPESLAKTFIASEGRDGQWSDGQWIGTVERILFFLAVVIEAPFLIAVWFAFKVASKWVEWQHIVQVSDKEEELSLVTRRHLGNYLFNRFIVGTGSNLIVAILAAAILMKLQTICS